MTNASPNILMLAPASMPPTNAEAIVNAKLALAMHAAGWSVDVLAMSAIRHLYADHDYTAWEPLPKIARCLAAEPAAEESALSDSMFAGLHFDRLPCEDHWVEAVDEAVSADAGYDVVISRASPLAAHAAACRIAQRLNIPWIANWNDPAPSMRYPPPYGQGPQAPVPPELQAILNDAVAYAAWHTFPSQRLRRYMAGYLDPSGAMLDRSSVVPHMAAERFHLSPPVRSGARKFVLCHAGELHPPRDGGVLLEGVRRFLDDAASPPPLRVRFLGREQKGLRDRAAALGLNEHVEYAGSRPYAQTLSELSHADVLVIIEAACPEGVFLPSKFVDYLQVGRPILAISPAQGTIADILSAHGGGIAADVTAPQAVASAVAELFRNWQAGQLLDTHGSQHLFADFSDQRVLAAYRAIFERLGIV